MQLMHIALVPLIANAIASNIPYILVIHFQFEETLVSIRCQKVCVSFQYRILLILSIFVFFLQTLYHGLCKIYNFFWGSCSYQITFENWLHFYFGVTYLFGSLFFGFWGDNDTLLVRGANEIFVWFFVLKLKFRVALTEHDN